MITILLLAFATRQESVTQSVHRVTTSLAQRAVEGDSVTAERRRWTRRLSADSTDRLALLHLASLDRLTYQYPAAERSYSRLRRSSTGQNDEIALSASIGLLETSFFTLPFDRGEQLAALAGEEARVAHDRSLEIEALVWRAWFHSRSAGPAAGSRMLESSRALLRGADTESRSRFHCVLSTLMSFEGRPEAELEGRNGLELARQTGDRRLVAKCYQLLAGHALNTKLPEVTLALFDSALTLQRVTRDRADLAVSLLWRGFLHIMLFDHDAARRDVAEGIRESEASVNPFTMAWALRHQGHLEWHTGELAEASTHLAGAVARLRVIGDSFGLNTVRDIQNGVALDRGDLVNAESLLRDNLSSAASRGFAPQVFSSMNGLAQTSMRAGNWAEADSRLKETIAYGRSNGLAFWLEGVRYDQAVVALRLGRLDEAERLLRGYLAASSPEQRIDRYSARSRLAELFLLRKNPSAAEAEIVAAMDELEVLRRSLDHRGLRIYLFQTHRGYDDPDAGFATIVAGLVDAGRIAPALALVERRRARHLSDKLQQPGQLDVSTDPGLRLVQDGRTAFVEYLTGRGSPTTVFVRTRDNLAARILPQADTLALSMKRAVALLESGAELTNYGAVLRRTWLDPILEELPASIDRLVFVLDGPLHHLPLEALPLPGGQALLARYTVSIVPSAATAERLAGQRSRGVVPGSVLALGDPAFAAESAASGYGIAEVYRSGFGETGGLVRLPGSAREVRRVARYARGSVVRVRSQASEAFLKRITLDSFQVIHFATHALVNEQSAVRTSLALSPGDGEDGFLGIDEIAELRIGADLVVLSGCSTAGGEVVGGEGILGLTGPLLGSGARAVIATMWRIGDESAITVVELLYRGLAEGLPVGEALQQAKLEALRRGMPAREWAAFVLIGDQMATVQLRPVSHRHLWIAVGGLGMLALLSYFRNRIRPRSDRVSVPSSSAARTHHR